MGIWNLCLYLTLTAGRGPVPGIPSERKSPARWQQAKKKSNYN